LRLLKTIFLLFFAFGTVVSFSQLNYSKPADAKKILPMRANATKTRARLMAARSRDLEGALDPIQISRFSTRWLPIQKVRLLSSSTVTGPSLIE